MNTNLSRYRHIIMICVSVVIAFGVVLPWTARVATAQSPPTLCKWPPTIPVLDDTIAHRVTQRLLAAGRVDTFGGAELKQAVKQGGRVIIHHGAQLSLSGYQVIQSHVETLPLYFHRAVGVS